MKKYIKPSVKAVAVSVEGMVCGSKGDNLPITSEPQSVDYQEYPAFGKEDDDDFLW